MCTKTHLVFSSIPLSPTTSAILLAHTIHHPHSTLPKQDLDKRAHLKQMIQDLHQFANVLENQITTYSIMIRNGSTSYHPLPISILLCTISASTSLLSRNMRSIPAIPTCRIRKSMNLSLSCYFITVRCAFNDTLTPSALIFCELRQNFVIPLFIISTNVSLVGFGM